MTGFTLDRPIRRARARYRAARRSLRNAKQILHFRFAFFLEASRLQVISFWRRALGLILAFLSTVIGTGIAVAFAIYLPNAFLDDPNLTVSGVHLTCAGIIGTALALVLTLSIVPAQRAAEAFSSAILKLYARDLRLQLVFASLSILALISLLFGTNWSFGISARYTLAVQIVALGAALDALRGFYTRALNLLDPVTALSLVERECNRSIGEIGRQVDRLAPIFRLAGKELDGEEAPSIRWILHLHSTAATQLSIWTNQLEEFAHKAIARHDTLAANSSVRTMASIGIKYADSRRDSLVLRLDFSGPIPVPTSDINNVLTPIYEGIKNICDDAARQHSEAVVMSCLQAIGDMSVHAMTMIHSESGQQRTAPLADAPIYYLDDCVKKAIPAGMDDALLTAIRALGQFLSKMSKTVYTIEAESAALDCLFNIATTSYPRQATVPCFHAVEMMLHAARLELQVRGFMPASILGTVLRKLTFLVPLEAMMDTAGQRTLQTFPAYSLGFESNIPALLTEVANSVEPVDPDRPWIDPFHDFAEASEKAVHHYRDVAKKVTFEGALLQKWIVDSVNTAAEVHIRLLQNPPQGSEPFLETVNNRLMWFIYTPQFFFRETTNFPSHHASEAAGRLAILGMRLLKIQRLEAAKACGEAIGSIGNRSVAATNENSYGTADILVKLEQLARAAHALGITALAEEFRQLANPVLASGESLPGYAEAIQTCIRQLDEDLEGYDHGFPMPHDPVPVLRQILRESQPTSPEM